MKIIFIIILAAISLAIVDLASKWPFSGFGEDPTDKEDEWFEWFAWRPVKIEGELVWLVMVERNFDGESFKYRKIKIK